MRGAVAGIATGIVLLLAAYVAALFLCRDDVCGKPDFIESIYPFIAENLFPYAVVAAPTLSAPNLPAPQGQPLKVGLLLALIQWPLYGMLLGVVWVIWRSGKRWMGTVVLLIALAAHLLTIEAAKNRVVIMVENRVYNPG